MKVDHFSIEERFRGPVRSGNGGYVCGLIASHLAGEGPVSVRLKAPPPLTTLLRLDYSATGAELSHGTTLIAEARTAALALEVPPAPSWPLAESASSTFIGFTRHKFPQCFVCGTERGPGDGLRIFPGAVPGGQVLAAPWIPDPSLRGSDGKVATEFLWAALDCPGAFALRRDTADTALVLGEFCAAVDRGVHPGERCVVLGWPLGSDGRKHRAGTAVYSGGELIAHAQATWIEVPLADWT